MYIYNITWMDVDDICYGADIWIQMCI
jgi:hypothetical protein